MASTALPKLPTKLDGYIPYLSKNADTAMIELVKPFKVYEAKLRELYAQEPGNEVLGDPYINTVPLFQGSDANLLIRARNLETESDEEKSKYIIPLSDRKRKATGTSAIVPTLKVFQNQFNIFTEQSLGELDWSNVVAAGSSALTPLLPILEPHNASKRSIRNYYHNIIAPASDVDLFLYGLSEEEALEKIKQIERSIKDSILSETTTIRTKNAITIASQHPVRHVQIVLRIYKSISEILTGFDVDSSCVAYDGKQVYATPRAISALVTQINEVDLTRRSPSYESRLSKYSHRGFEIHWPQLDRTKIDPTIYERSFPRTVGLARLLVLEQLPKDIDRTNYSNQRRVERGRPINNDVYDSHAIRGNVKEEHQDEVADWKQEDEISNYHSFTVPYGPKIHARRIEKLLYTKDLLLNAEWNTKARKTKLHRHPAFIGDAEHIFEDCCGFCPEPETEEDKLLAEEESRNYVSGKMTFITDDPGRQAIGSFNPIIDTDWTDMAYISENGRLCQAVVDCDVEAVRKCIEEGIDVNRRDYVGRTILHLATSVSSADVVKLLLRSGAYIVPRIADGQTALHLACVRGDEEILQALFDKNEENKAAADQVKALKSVSDFESSDDDASDEAELVDGSDIDSQADSEASAAASDFSAFLKVETVDKYFKRGSADKKDDGEVAGNAIIQPKDDILDANFPAWDSNCTPAHLATIFGNVGTLKMLFREFAADSRIPVKLMDRYYNTVSRDAILSLVLALNLPLEKAKQIVQVLIENGARCSQANITGITAYSFFVNNSIGMLELLHQHDAKHAKLAINHLSLHMSYAPTWTAPIRIAIENRDVKMVRKLLDFGAEHEIDKDQWTLAYKHKFESNGQNMDQEDFKKLFIENTQQPVILAVKHESPEIVKALIEAGASVNTLNASGSAIVNGYETRPRSDAAQSVLDAVREKIRDLEADGTATSVDAPEKPQGLNELLKGVKSDTYNHWYISEYIRRTEANYKEKLKVHEATLADGKNIYPTQNKVKMIKALLEEYRALDKYLVARGAKTFGVLHLNYEKLKDEEEDRAVVERRKREAEQRKLARRTKDSQKQEVPRSYGIEGLTDSRKADYLKLFEAAWVGDFALIRKLTTQPRGAQGEEPPLKITANDSMELCPWDIAILRGHIVVALQMLDIVQAQYMPRKKLASYTIRSDYSDEESDSDDESGTGTGVRLYERLPASVRDQFTIDNIGEISTAVKGVLNPVQMFVGTLPIKIMAEISKVKIPQSISPDDSDTSNMNFYGFAMLKNDLDLFNTFVDTAMKYQQFTVDLEADEATSTDVSTSIWDDKVVDTAIRLGKPQFLSVMIARTGAGISFDHIIKKGGGEVAEKTRYYQGLSIRGHKNKAWAQLYRNNWNSASLAERPLLLRACKEGSIESVEWLMSDAPLRVYSEFAAANKDKESIQVISKGKGGFEHQVGQWLDTRRELALHCAIMSEWNTKTDQLVSYLIKAIPESINAKSVQGRSPLMLAFALRLPSVAKLLIEAGADIEAIDKQGNNILHALLTIWRNTGWNAPGAPHDHIDMEKMLLLLEPSVVTKLLLRRNSYAEGGAQTPLQVWLSKHDSNAIPQHDEAGIATLKLILKHSGSEALSMIDGTGDTAVHSVIAKPQAAYLKAMIAFSPSCLFRENAVGRTPVEVARDNWLQEQVQESPVVGVGLQHWHIPQARRRITDRSLDWFKTCSTTDEPTKASQVWEICQAHVQQAGAEGKRKLVSLAEANEVAKRLAEKQKRSTEENAEQYARALERGLGGPEERPVKDEVELWFKDRLSLTPKERKVVTMF